MDGEQPQESTEEQPEPELPEVTCSGGVRLQPLGASG